MNIFLLLLALLSPPPELSRSPRVPSALANGTKFSLKELHGKPISEPFLACDWVDSNTLLFCLSYQKDWTVRSVTFFVTVKPYISLPLPEYSRRYSQLKLMPSGIRASFSNLSPDRKKLLAMAYSSHTIYVMDLQGKILRQWKIPAKFAPQGSRLYWFTDSQRCVLLTNGQEPHLLVFHLKQKNPTHVLPVNRYWKQHSSTPLINGEILGFTSDNRLLCSASQAIAWGTFVQGGPLFSLDLGNLKSFRLTKIVPPNGWQLIYSGLSPDKQKLLWIANNDQGKGHHVLLSDTEGKSWRILGSLPRTTQYTYKHYYLRWNPDGKHFSILYGNDLWLIPIPKE